MNPGPHNAVFHERRDNSVLLKTDAMREISIAGQSQNGPKSLLLPCEWNLPNKRQLLLHSELPRASLGRDDSRNEEMKEELYFTST
jgi:hypothetical protein